MHPWTAPPQVGWSAPAGAPPWPWPQFDPDAPVPLTGAERGWVPASHWLPLVTSWLGPLVVLLTVGERHSRVREHAKESLNFEVTFCLVVLLVSIVALQLPGTLLWLLPLWPAWIVTRLWATSRSLVGRPVRYPVALRIIR